MNALTFLASLPLLLPGSTAPVQDARPRTVAPGSDLVRPRDLPEHSATYVLWSGSGPERVAMQRVRRELERVERDGKALVRLAWHTNAMGRDVVDELFLDPRTLVPRARTIPLPDGGEGRLEIEGTRVQGVLNGPDGAETERVDVTFTAPLHDASVPLLLALPLEEGAVFRLATMPPVLDASPAEPAWLRVEVGTRAPFELEPGIALDAWTLRLVPESDGPTTTLVLADEEPFVLRKEVVMPGFGEIVWELAEGD